MDMEITIPKKRKNNKLKAIIISSLILIVIVSCVLLLIFCIVPAIRYNTACELLEQEQYMQAYDVFSQLDDYKDSYQMKAECFVGYLYEATLSKDDYKTAFEVLNDELCDSTYEYRYSYSYNNVIASLPSLNIKQSDYEKYYNELVEIINDNPSFDYWDDSYGNSRNSQLMYYLLSNLPLEYKDVSALIMLFTDLKSGEIHPIADYMKANRNFLFTLWEYGFVRDFSTNDYNIKEYLSGVWSTDNSDNIPFYDPFTLKFLRDDGNITFESTGLSVPNITHRYYDIENCTLIYTNGDSKLCNVFRFSIDKTDPNKITVYCYEDGKSFVFYRVM